MGDAGMYRRHDEIIQTSCQLRASFIDKLYFFGCAEREIGWSFSFSGTG